MDNTIRTEGTDVVDVEQHAVSGKDTPKNAQRWRIRIDDAHHVVDKPSLSARELLILAQKTAVEELRLMQFFHDGHCEIVELDQVVCFHVPGLERLVTVTTHEIAAIVDVEEHAGPGKEKPKHAKHWRIRIDKVQYIVHRPCMTGRALLLLAGKKPPEQFRLLQRFHHGRVEVVGLDQEVCFCAPGVERFLTIPLDQPDGEESVITLRQQFTLPAVDREFLEGSGLAWETIIFQGQQWVILKDYPLPSGYAQQNAEVAVQIPPGYRDCQIDMVYFFPVLQRRDSKPIPATTMISIDGRQWQQWSRHRTPANPWRPGIDDLSTHFRLVDFWLERELRR